MEHYTDEAQTAGESLELTRLFVECQPEDLHRQAYLDCGEIVSSSVSFVPLNFGGVLLSPLLGLSLQLYLVV